jgi:hypothetical protein
MSLNNDGAEDYVNRISSKRKCRRPRNNTSVEVGYSVEVDNNDNIDSDEPNRQLPRLNMLATYRQTVDSSVKTVGMTDLIWDTGASEHLLEKLLSNYRNLH